MARFLLLLCLLLCALPTLAAPQYKSTPLPGLNVDDGNAFLNNKGMVACGDKVWQDGRTWTIHNPLSDPLYRFTNITGINDAGTVIGTFGGSSDGAWLVSYGRVFTWRKGRLRLLPPTDNTGLSVPYAAKINNVDDALVSVKTQSPNPDEEFTEDFLYHAGHYKDVSKALMVNNVSRLVTIPKALLPQTDNEFTIAAINGAGTVVGESDSNAVLWRKGQFQDLGMLGGEGSTASGINTQGQIVGKSDLAHNETTHAFLWQNGRMTDLNTLIPAHSGWVLTEADAINDRGQIVCAGNKGACLLTPLTTRKRRG